MQPTFPTMTSTTKDAAPTAEYVYQPDIKQWYVFLKVNGRIEQFHCTEWTKYAAKQTCKALNRTLAK